jgi:hypothetical protein
MKDKSKLYKSSGGEMKQCFCIGAENCDDENCSLVKACKEKTTPSEDKENV